MELNYDNLCIVGDIHGKFTEFSFKIWQEDIKDTAFIVAGDFGLGFHKRGYYERVYLRIKKKLEDKGNCLLGIRGNHDNPEYYDENSLMDYPLFKAIPDFTRLTWKDREILVIGGATSVDKSWRIEHMKTKPKEFIWWEGERPTRIINKLKEKEDIIISHEAPLCIGPVITRTDNMELETYHNILEDRKFLDTVLKDTRPERYYFGHYHRSTSGNWGNTLWKGLDINEIIEVR